MHSYSKDGIYKILIVDDEEIEREGMAQLIPWNEFGIEMVGTARDGAEGLEKIETLDPDIVLTDIKMPIMNGLELIKKGREKFPNVEWVVLSGYGEYEFTSRAMEQGIRYYLLKPCDEDQIEEVLSKVKKNMAAKQLKIQEEQEYRQKAEQVFSFAKEQMFQDLILEKEETAPFFKMEMEKRNCRWRLLAFYWESEPDEIKQFMVKNIISELLEDIYILSTAFGNQLIILLQEGRTLEIEKAVKQIIKQCVNQDRQKIWAILSEPGSINELPELYKQVQWLFQIREMAGSTSFLQYDLFQQNHEYMDRLVDYGKIRNAKDYGTLAFEVCLTFMKFTINQYTPQQKYAAVTWILQTLYGTDFHHEIVASKSEDLMEQMVNYLAERKGMQKTDSSDVGKVQEILLAIFVHIDNPQLNLNFLAKKILYRNEDYLGKIFRKVLGERFSVLLPKIRMFLAKRLFQYRPEMKIATVAEIVGYSPNGQYFSKSFRKIIHMTPSQYKEYIIQEQRTQ